MEEHSDAHSDAHDNAPDVPSGGPAFPAAGGDPFASSLADLEAHVAAADRAGESVPPEARRMLARLRELSSAISALSESMGRPPAPPEASGAEPR